MKAKELAQEMEGDFNENKEHRVKKFLKADSLSYRMLK